jgi:predicted nuclease of predicted toxin-antitoxin system
MKLLFDNNLSSKLVRQLATLYPDSNHVMNLGLDAASDVEVWEYAKQNDYCLVTKDSDFNEILASKGFPPKVIWIRLGNCTTAEISALLQKYHVTIAAFGEDDAIGLLQLQ